MSKTTIFSSIYTILINQTIQLTGGESYKITRYLSIDSESMNYPVEEEDFSPSKIKYFKSFEDAYHFLHHSPVFQDKDYIDYVGHTYYIAQIFIS